MVKRSRESLSNFINQTESHLSEIISKAENSLGGIDQEFQVISKNKTSSAEEFGAIKQLKTDAESILTELRTYNIEFLTLKKQLSDENDGMEAVYTDSKESLALIEEGKEKAQQTLIKMEKLAQQSESLKSTISEFERITTDYKEKIKDTYSFMNGQGLAHSFFERKNELQKYLKFWKWTLICSVLLLAILISWFYLLPPGTLKSNQNLNDWAGIVGFFIFRITLLSPLVFTVAYAAIQYSRERTEVSQYAFKGGIAKALENYTDLLTDKFEDKKNEYVVRDKILNFTISSMTDIYENPHKKNSKCDCNYKKKLFQALFKNNKIGIQDLQDKVVKPLNDTV